MQAGARVMKSQEVKKKSSCSGGVLLLLSLFGAGCGQVGPPLPPSRNLPRPVSNLRATRRGGWLRLHWTPPTKTTGGERIAGPVRLRVCLWPARRAQARPTPGMPCPYPWLMQPTYRAATLPGEMRLRLSGLMARLPAEENEPETVRLAIEFVNRARHGAGWSNWQLFSSVPASAPPRIITARVSQRGVDLRWQAPRPAPAGYRVYRETLSAPARSQSRSISLKRTLAGSSPRPAAGSRQEQIRVTRHWRPLADLPARATRYLDRTARNGWRYRYTVRALTVFPRGPRHAGLSVESENAAPAELWVRQRIPPAAPRALEAIVGLGHPPTVHLSWLPVPNRHLAGYDIYRQRAGGPWRKLNSTPQPATTYTDASAFVHSATARYGVRAVSTRHLTSPLSNLITVTAP